MPVSGEVVGAKPETSDNRVASRIPRPSLLMLAWTRLLRPTPRAVCARSLAHKAASDVSKVVSERTAAAGTLPGGE